MELNQKAHVVSDFALVFGIGTLYSLILWPGIMGQDSPMQYAQAISGQYSTHHPPLMSFVWGFLNTIYPGSGLIFLLHSILFFSAIYFLMQTIPHSKLRYAYLGILCIPQIISQSTVIFKDVGFAFCFLYVASYCAKVTLEKRTLIWYELIGLLPILFYGTAIKFQAQYCAPILIAWIAYLLANQEVNRKTYLFFTLIMIPFYGSLCNINTLIIKQKVHNSHAWQFVKLFDLAAMSIDLHTDLIPNFCKKPIYSFENLHNQFNPEQVDPIILRDHSILMRCTTETQRTDLLNLWWQTITNHPVSYLKHRARLLGYTLTHIIGSRFIQPMLTKLISPQDPLYPLAAGCISIFTTLGLSSLPVLILMLLYLLLALVSLNKSRAAIPLLMFNLIGLTLFIILFFFTMASDTRYAYAAVCLTHSSHIFAYLCLNALFKKTSKINLEAV